MAIDKFSIGQVVVWKRKKWLDSPEYIPCMYLGPSVQKGGNYHDSKRAHLRALWINGKVMIRDLPQVDVKNVMSISAYLMTKKDFRKD